MLSAASERSVRSLEREIADGQRTSPWAGLHSRFLDSLDADEQVHIFDLSARMAQKLHRWAARYPLIRRVRAWPLALSVAAAAPFSSVDALVSTARVSLWVFTLDDIFDEERVTQAELMRRAERYRAIGAQQQRSPEDGDSLAAALAEVREDLSGYPLFRELGDEWAEALRGTIESMIREYQWRLAYQREGPSALPSDEEYLANGLYSIDGPPHVWASLITTNDPSTPRHLEQLRAMEQIASTCISLANDLQSYEKEVAEGSSTRSSCSAPRWRSRASTPRKPTGGLKRGSGPTSPVDSPASPRCKPKPARAPDDRRPASRTSRGSSAISTESMTITPSWRRAEMAASTFDPRLAPLEPRPSAERSTRGLVVKRERAWIPSQRILEPGT